MNRISQLLWLALLLAAAMAARADLTDGLVSYWPLDVTNLDGTTPDLSFGNNLTVVGAPGLATGQVSNGLTFASSGTWLGLTNAANSGALYGNAFSTDTNGLPIFRAGAYSVLMWLKYASPATARFIFSEGSTNSTSPILLFQTGQALANSNKFDVILRNDAGVTLINHAATASIVFDGAWHHVAWVDNRGTVSVYVDGVLDANSATFHYLYVDGSLTLNNLSIANLLRTMAGTTTFPGSVDDVAIWERALTQAEVNHVRTNGIPPPIPARAPTFAVAPADQTRHLNDWALFSVRPMGTRPFTGYQWSQNGSPTADATDRTYQTAALGTNNTGDYYSVTVSNSVGSATTTPNATLTVLDDPAPNPLSGLVEYWPLDVFDASTNSPELHYGHNMRMVNMDTNSQIAAGQYSNSVFFIAGNPTYGIKTAGAPTYSASNYTVAMWVNATGAGQIDRRVFSEGSTNSNNQLWSLGTDNTGASSSATVFVRSDANQSMAVNGRKSTRAVFDGTWHHLVWTDASGQGRLYVDGTLDETDYTYTRPALSFLNLTEIGATARAPTPLNPFSGYLDEMATWNRVLSWTEIRQIMTNGVPIPPAVTAPSLVTQPLNQTNNVYVHDDITFFVSADGTLPFAYHCYKNGAATDSPLNPTAATDTLSLPNVQVATSNTTYFVTIANAAGSVTSSVVRLYVNDSIPVGTGVVAMVDFDLSTLADIQPGFSEMSLATNPAFLANAVKVTISGIGATLAERHRFSPPDATMVVNNPPWLTQAQLYNDFIFANNNTTDGTGLRVLIEHLKPNTTFGVTVWSFDPISAPDRVSDWTETASGSPVTIQIGSDFNGAAPPTNDFNNTFGGLLTSSSLGRLHLEGLRDGGASFGVFVNAIRLEANPSPSNGLIRGVLNNGNVRITGVVQYPGQPLDIQQTSDLVNGPWVPAVGGVPVSTNGMVIDIDFPLDPAAPQLFYRGSR